MDGAQRDLERLVVSNWEEMRIQDREYWRMVTMVAKHLAEEKNEEEEEGFVSPY